MTARSTGHLPVPAADRCPAGVKDMLTLGLARACHYAAARPGCQVLAAVWGSEG